MRAEDVTQGGNVGTFGMASLYGLFELLWVPSSTMFFAACETANTLARDICAASSMNKVSTHSNASGRAQTMPWLYRPVRWYQSP